MRKVWPVFLLLILIIIFFYRQFFLGEVFYFGDNFSLILPTLQFLANQIKQGYFPLWNPYLFSGIPFLPEIALGILNPLTLLFLIFSPFQALTWEIIIQVFLSGLFCFWFLRSLNLGELESLLGAIVFGFSASILTFINNLSLISTAYLLPLILLIAQKILSSQKYFTWVILLGLAMVWQFISGHPQITFYSFSLGFFYFLFYPGIPLIKKIKLGAISTILFLVLSAFEILPFLEAVSLSTRPTSFYSYITAWSLHPLLLIRLILPHFFGTAVSGISWGPAYRLVADNTGYFGILPLIIIGLGWLTKKKKRFEVIFFTVILILTILLAMGKYTPIFVIFYHLFPGFKLFRSPTQILLLTDFAAAVLSALLWSDFKNLIKRNVWPKVSQILLIILGSLLIFLGILYLGRQRFFVIIYDLIGKAYYLLRKVPLSHSPFHRFSVDQVIFELILGHLILALLFLISFMAIVYLWQRKKIPGSLFNWLSLFLIFINLAVFNRNNYFSVKPQSLTIDRKVVDYLKTKEHGRIISSAGYWPFTGLNVYWENISLRPPIATSVFTPEEQKSLFVLRNRLRTLPPNWGMVEEIATPMGYGDLILASYADFMSQKTGRINVNEVDALPLNDEKLNLLGVKYLLVDSSFPSTITEVESLKQFSLIKELDNVKIYENRQALPRAFLVQDGQVVRAAQITNYDTDKVKIRTESEGKSRLVLTDIVYPGWRVLVDNQEKKIVDYKNIFRSVELEPGQHQIEFIYQPQSFNLGVKISLGGLFLVGLLLVINLRKKKIR